MNIDRYNFFEIPMKVYLTAGLFFAAFVVILLLAYRDAGSYRRKEGKLKGEK